MVSDRTAHIRVGTDRVAYCGAGLGPEKLALFGVDNAIKSMQAGHDVGPCPACAQVVMGWMAKVVDAPPGSTAA